MNLPKTSALILAGGEGERLLPLTISRPKPAIPFGGTFRIIDFTLANCLQSEVADVAILTQHRREQLDTYIRQYWSDVWEESRRPFICLPPTSGKRYRGTADAVFQNLPVIQPRKPECVLILSASHVYNMNYGDLLRQHAESGADLTIGVVESIEKPRHLSTIKVDNALRVLGFAENAEMPQPTYHSPHTALVNMGVYAFRTEILERALREHCADGFGYDFARDIIPALIQSAKVHAYDFRDEMSSASPSYWRDITTVDSYYAANMDLAGYHPAFNPYGRPAFGPLRFRASVHAESNVSHSVFSPDVQIEADAHVESSILMAGVRVGKNARIRRAIIEEGVHIPSGFQIGWDIEHDRKHYAVSTAGVVIVNQTPRASMPALAFIDVRKRKTPRRPASRAAAA